MKLVYRGQSREVEVTSNTTLGELRCLISSAFDISPGNQKIIWKGKDFSKFEDYENLGDIGLENTFKVLLMGIKEDEEQQIRELEQKMKRREVNRMKTASYIARQQAKERHQLPTVFQRLQVLQDIDDEPGVPPASEAMNLLKRIATDEAIVAIMVAHGWSVGLLKEFAPGPDTGMIEFGGCLLGYNQNKGQEIGLRLRTDDFQGFRHYHVIIKTVLHELTHMVHTDHDKAFYALNSQLNKEYKLANWKTTQGQRVLQSGSQAPVISSSPSLSSSTGFRLGGSSSTSSTQNPRDIIANAALKRIKNTQPEPSEPSDDETEQSSCSTQPVESQDQELVERQRMTQVWKNVHEAELQARENPYEYRPRRSVKVGQEYQAVIPDLIASSDNEKTLSQNSTEEIHRFGHEKPMMVIDTTPISMSSSLDDHGDDGDDDDDDVRIREVPMIIDNHDVGGEVPINTTNSDPSSSFNPDEDEIKIFISDMLSHASSQNESDSARNMLLKIFNNILAHPDDDKYRSINIKSKSFQTTFQTPKLPWINVFSSIGFVKGDEHLTMTQEQLSKSKSILKSILREFSIHQTMR